MSIFGIGTDILSINRIKNVILNKFKIKFSQKILTVNELHDLYKNNNQKLFLAKRFAIKEAASKALGTGMRNGITFNNFELYHNNLGKPFLKFLGKAKEFSERVNIKKIHVSLSDEKSYVFAVVILEK